MDNGIKKVAVENFLMSMDASLPKRANIDNAVRDALLYGWNIRTLDAIVTGIEQKYLPKEPS